jgi:hypothetical protein
MITTHATSQNDTAIEAHPNSTEAFVYVIMQNICLTQPYAHPKFPTYGFAASRIHIFCC